MALYKYVVPFGGVYSVRGNMRNKDKIEILLRELSLQRFYLEDSKGITASEISECLGIQRNIVSQYLNQLCKDNIAVKINTRPVYFWSKDVLVKDEDMDNEVDDVYLKVDPFIKLIGYNGSLKNQVEQCKAAAIYPGNGLPIILTGLSGVGKSYMAQLIYEYALYKGCIEYEAPFITFNCADYANNPELLSANLFGYKKGAFTGADKDTIGIIESSHGGYLFLDEVHRLSKEGQEKLFLFLDQGKFKRIGEADKWRCANVRLVFATTENLENVLLDTFRRRIPITVDIPSIDKRSISERLNLIYTFYLREADKIQRDLIVDRKVVNIMMSLKGNGNIGLLKNLIVSSCANAYKDNKNIKNMNININHIDYINRNNFNINGEIYKDDLSIMRNEVKECMNIISKIEENKDIEIEIKNIFSIIQSFEEFELDSNMLKKNITNHMNKILNNIVFDKSYIMSDILTYEFISKIVSSTFQFIWKGYGIRYNESTVKLITSSIMIIKNMNSSELNNNLNLKEIHNIIEKIMPQSYTIGEKISKILEDNIQYKNSELINIYICLYVYSFLIKEKNKINAIIVAHGYSTASSIASVANNMFEDFIFEAFDMPMDMDLSSVVSKMKIYMKNVDTTKGTLILVDMGSLNEIYKELKDVVSGNLGIINNISTQLALDVANNIMQSNELSDIVHKCSQNNKTEYKYYELQGKKSVIVVSCISGLGIAEKLKEILKKCIGDAYIEIKSEDYNTLKYSFKESIVYKNYEIKLIITTTALEVEGIPIVEVKDIMNKEGNKKIENALSGFIKKKKIESINKDIIKFFSMQNIINQLTILNPEIVIEQVERIIYKYEHTLNVKFPNDLKIVLYMHISVMIERLILRQGVVLNNREEEFINNNKYFIDITNDIFEDIVKQYRLDIPIGEIIAIYDIIFIRMK